MTEIEARKQIRDAIRRGSADDVERLIGADSARLNMMTTFGTWLHAAARLGQVEVLRRLVAMGANVNARGGTSGGRPLTEAAAAGQVEAVKFLLSHGASLDVSVSEQNPLFRAIIRGHAEVAKSLIEAGIDTQISYTSDSMDRMDAVAFAREWGRNDIVDLLIASGCKDNKRRGRRLDPAIANDPLMMWIREHLGEPDALSLQQVLPSNLALRIHTVPWRNETRLVVTAGMSGRPMTVPEGQERYQYAELLMVLPPNWPTGPDAMKSEIHSWPYLWLRKVASYPYELGTWLRSSIVISCGEELYPGAAMNSLLVVADTAEFGAAHLTDGRVIALYVVTPLYPEERELAKREGAGVLVELLRRSGLFPTVNVGRRNVGLPAPS